MTSLYHPFQVSFLSNAIKAEMNGKFQPTGSSQKNERAKNNFCGWLKKILLDEKKKLKEKNSKNKKLESTQQKNKTKCEREGKMMIFLCEI